MSEWDSQKPLSALVGKTLERITRDGDDSIDFFATDGSSYRMNHDQNCCESVSIEDVAGDLDDLVGSPIIVAEESSNSDDPKKGDYDESHTWTFYRIATAKGLVVIRWYGTSNGYYSESVTFWEMEAAKAVDAVDPVDGSSTSCPRA